MSKTKHQHLVRNVPNTKDNRAFIKQVNKMSKESDSIWKLFIKYRKPKKGFKYGSGGSLKRENANAFSVYIEDRRPYGGRPIDNAWSRGYELKEENNILKKKLAIYSNPYIDFSEDEIKNEMLDIESDILDEVLVYEEKPNFLYILGSHKKRYNQLKEALEYVSNRQND